MPLLSFHYKIVPHHGTCGLLPACPMYFLYLKARSSGKSRFLRRKGYFGAVGESEPASLPHSFIILAPRRTHTLAGLRRRPCTWRRGHAGARCVSGSYAWPPNAVAALELRGAHPQHHSTRSNFCTGGHQPVGRWVASPCFGEQSVPRCPPPPSQRACACPIAHGGLGATRSCQSTFPSLRDETSGVGRDGFKRGQGIPSHPNQKGEHIPPCYCLEGVNEVPHYLPGL